jgi:hypothetical protein
MRKIYSSTIPVKSLSGLLLLFLFHTASAQYFPVKAVNDQQVVIVPGTANGNVITNDQIFGGGPYTLTQLSSPANGNLTFNTTTGAYTYIPGGTFQGADFWTYRICDGGSDGNLATTADNNCSVARVTFRNIFNCKNTLFYIPIPENEARDFLEDINTGNNDSTRLYVGLSVLGEGYIVYDHWEDGYETNITNPLQSSTQIWGDGDISNGAAPGYPTDIVPAGSTIIITNNLSSGHDNTVTYDPNAAGADAVLQSVIDFDGKDKVYASGEASMSKFAWGSIGTLSTSSSAVPPTRDWGTSFILPIGQNTGGSAGTMFEITSMSVIAKDDNTVVSIDRDANGVADTTVTLNEGETYYVDSRQGATIIPVNRGATVSATNDVQVMLMTGDFNSGYAGRTFALTPTASLSSSYYMPAVPGETVRVFLYNPTASGIIVTRTTAGGSVVNINVPANSSSFSDVNSSGLGYNFSSSVPFVIVATVDLNAAISDWGFTPVPSSAMSPVALCSFAEGSDPTNVLYGTNNYSKILVTPDCNTYVYVDVNGDGLADKVSFNDDIDVLDAAVTIGGINYDETVSDQGTLVNQYQTLTIGGPAGSLNGARIWTMNGPGNSGGRGCNLAVVYGQDGGPNGAPNIDAGYTLPKTSIPLEVNTTWPSSVCPANTGSFIEPTIVDINGVAPFNVLLVNQTTNEVIQLVTNSANVSLNAANPGNYILKINDANCLTFELSFTINSNTNCSTNAVNDENSTWQDVNVEGNVLTNDFDLEGHTQTFGSFINPFTLAPITTGDIVSGVDKTGAPVLNAGALSFDANGNYTFDPEPGFVGSIYVPYVVCDNGLPSFCDTAVLIITVDPLPLTGTNTVIANNDENISYGSPVANNVLTNDRDPQGDLFAVTAVTGSTPGNSFTVPGTSANGTSVADAGTLVINPDGSYIYTPAPGFAGSIDVPYTITDAQGAVSAAILHIDVLFDQNGPSNDPPFAGDDFIYTTVNTPQTGSFINNDNDPNSDPVSYNGVTIVPGGPATAIGSPVTTAQGGTIQFFANGTYLYTPPAGYTGPDQLVYSICDVTAVPPQPLCADATIHILIAPGISISGKVWDDANGDVIDNGAGEPETNISNQLYVNLLNASGDVVATVPVAPDGTYSFTDITPGTNYSIQLTSVQGTVGQPAPAVLLPSGWVNTGETRGGIIDAGTAGVIDSRYYGFVNVINLDFGIEQTPSADDYSTNIDQPSIGQFITLDGGANPPVLSGSDPEDCNAGCTLPGNTVIIETVPANADLYYNGSLVTAGQQISNFNPTLLQVQITAATAGALSTSFTYSFLDSAGQKDPSPATYTLTWLVPLPVTGLSARANLDGGNVTVMWQTLTELNTKNFVVERSIDNRNFMPVGNPVAAAGNSNSLRKYQLTDNIGRITGVIFYRVKMIDADGKTAYSNTVPVRLRETNGITVWPNPFSHMVVVSIQSQEPARLLTSVTDVTGKTVAVSAFTVTAGASQFTINNLEALANGVYILTVVNEKTSERIVQKLVKK